MDKAAYIEKLAREAKFGAALPLIHEGDLLGRSERTLYGVDHRTYCGATPLMLAARAGNLALVEELLERGADADLVDDYGHTAWMGALNRAIDDHAFGKAHLASSSSAWARIRSMFTRTGGSCGWSAVRASFGCWV